MVSQDCATALYSALATEGNSVSEKERKDKQASKKKKERRKREKEKNKYIAHRQYKNPHNSNYKATS